MRFQRGQRHQVPGTLNYRGRPCPFVGSMCRAQETLLDNLNSHSNCHRGCNGYRTVLLPTAPRRTSCDTHEHVFQRGGMSTHACAAVLCRLSAQRCTSGWHARPLLGLSEVPQCGHQGGRPRRGSGT